MSDYPKFSELGGEVKLIRRYANLDDKAWSAFNPSIMLSNEGEYWMAFRSSNYVFFTDGGVGITTEAKVRNKLYLVKLNPETWEFEDSTLKEIDVSHLRNDIKRNVEDPRLFWDGHNYCVSVTFLEKTVPVARISKITLESLESAKPISVEIYPSPTGKIEKNWMPIAGTKDYIYASDVVLKNGEFKNITAPEISKHFRGGSQVIKLDNGGSVSIIHQVYIYVEKANNPKTFSSVQYIRKYTHRAVKYDSNYKITHVSPEFVFLKEGIEFVSGITQYKNKFVISLGRSDVATYIATIDKKTLLDMLEEVDD